MSRYRNQLPQLSGHPFLTDGGLETTMVFHEAIELPHFAAFHMLRDDAGVAKLKEYFARYTLLAKRFHTGFILESVTWRANSDWGERIGYSRAALADANRAAIRLLEEIRAEMAHEEPVVLSGCVGPRGDGYFPKEKVTVQQAADYHQAQIDVLASTAADLVAAVTMNYVEEATGIARAAQRSGMPVVISFTLETDGRLPTGQTLEAAIEEVDGATAGYPAYYMINCAHPSHFESAIAPGAAWASRIGGLRANSSRRSHKELNECADLDTGNPAEFGAEYATLRRERLTRLNVLGGCCGTDHRHVEAVAESCIPSWPRP